MLLFKIQRFSLHDGPGIRTTFFFKGCPLQCAWCHNPESWRFQTEDFYDKNACRGCQQCEVLEFCPLDLKGNIGEYYTIDTLVQEALKDQAFYQNTGGGVTLSGGEVLAQPAAELLTLVRALHRAGLSVALDTSGYGQWHVIEGLLPYLDCVLFDIKTLDAQAHLAKTGVDNAVILDNLKRLLAAITSKHQHGQPRKRQPAQPSAPKPLRLHLRLPLIGGFNDTLDNALQLVAFLKRHDQHHAVDQIDLLPYHALGHHKGERLKTPISLESFEAPSAAAMEAFAQTLKQSHYKVTIGGTE